MKQAIKDFLFKEIMIYQGGLVSIVLFCSIISFYIGIYITYNILSESFSKQCAELIYESYIKVPR